MHGDGGDDAILALRAAVDALGLDHFELWLEYLAVGGNADVATVAGWLVTEATPPDRDYILLALVMNEALMERGLDPDVPWTR